MTHAEISQRTKRALADALKRQACSRPFSKITVSDLVAECNINRKTFYYHFADIYALLQWTMEQETFDLLERFDPITEAEGMLNFALDYIDSNEKFLKSVYHSMGQGELKTFFYNDFVGMFRAIADEFIRERHLTLSESFLRFACGFYADAVAGALCVRMENNCLVRREQELQYINRLIRETFRQALKTGSDMQC